jgi:hypothetical protein
MSDNQNSALVPFSSSNNQNQLQQNQNQEIANFNLSLDEIEKLAKHFVQSGLFGIGQNSFSQSVIKMLAGKELGIAPFTAVKEIYIIEGKLALSAHLIGALIKKTGIYNYKIIEHNNNKCSIDFTKNNELLGNSTFTIDDAKTAGLIKDKGAYQKFPKNMLYARALTNGANWFCPEVFRGGVYTPEQLQEDSFIDAQVEQPNQQEIEQKEKIINQINKLNQMLIEIKGETFFSDEVDLKSLTLEQLKQDTDNLVALLKEILIAKIKRKNPDTITENKNVIELYQLYKSL